MMPSTMLDSDCLNCKTRSTWTSEGSASGVCCPRCGEYRRAAKGDYDPLTDTEKVKVAGWIRAQNAAGIVPFIDLDCLSRLKTIKLPRLKERSRRALQAIAKKYPSYSQLTEFRVFEQDLELRALTYSASKEEVMLLVNMLIEQDFLYAPKNTTTNRPSAAQITVKGIVEAEELGSAVSGSLKAFVAMSFDKKLDEAWSNGFYPAVKAAGYEPLRIDDKDYIGGVTDEIMAELRRSRFVIADYTGQKNGVYFEAGFALGLNLFVIPTCQADENR
jgi:hypothetical protein